MRPVEREIDVDRYLTYLDKEMTIMGILSGFCAAALALAIKLLFSKDVPRIDKIVSDGPVSLALGLLMLLLAALAFYLQRSLLAWYYGQISLEASGHITHQRLRQWLRDADGWDTWINYQRGFWLLAGAFGEFGLAALAACGQSSPRPGTILPATVWGGSILALIILAALILQALILRKFPQAENPYEEFREAPFSILRRT